MNYTNDKIKKLIQERDNAIAKYNSEINQEIEKEKAKYKFSWKRFFMLTAIIIGSFTMFKLNEIIFPDTSIWSWEYYLK